MPAAEARGGRFTGKTRSAIFVTGGGTVTAPNPPASAAVTDKTTDSISFAWVAPTAGTTPVSYNVYVLEAGPVETLLDNVVGTAYTADGLDVHTAYIFAIRSVDAAATESTAPTHVGATTEYDDVAAPTTPGSFNVSAIGQRGATFTWAASTDPAPSSGIRRYRLYYEQAGVGEVDVAYVAFGTNSKVISNFFTAGTTYDMRLTAEDNAGNVSAPTTKTFTTTAATDTVAPNVVTGLASPAQGITSIDLSWNTGTDPAPSSGIAYYEVLRSTTQAGTYAKVSPAGGVSGTTWTDTGRSASTTYWYKVRAVDNAGNVGSGQTNANAVSATTDAAADTTPPTSIADADFFYDTATNDGFTLHWAAATDAESGIDHYELWVAGSRVATQRTATGAATSLDWDGLDPSTTYAMRIVAVNPGGQESATPGAVDALTNATPPASEPWPVFGIVRGNSGTNAEMSDFATLLGSGHQLRLWRLEVSWMSMWSANGGDSGNGVNDLYPNPPNSLNAFSAMIDLPGPQQYGLALLGYTAPEFVYQIPLGAGHIVLGGDTFSPNAAAYIQLDTPLWLGPTESHAGVAQWTHGGKWEALAVFGPGLPARNGLYNNGVQTAGVGEGATAGPGEPAKALSVNRQRVYLKSGGGTISAGGNGQFVIGGSRVNTDSYHMLPMCSASADSVSAVGKWQELEPIGKVSYRMIKMLNPLTGTTPRRASHFEPANEVNWGLGSRPWADHRLLYRNQAHAFVGAKLADPKIRVYQASPGAWIGPNYPAHYPYALLWNEFLHDYAVAAGRDYFRNLYVSAFGKEPPNPDPWDILNMHIYGEAPDNPKQRFHPMTAMVYNVWNNDNTRGPGPTGAGTGKLGRYRIGSTEFGPDYFAEPNSTAPGGKGWEYAHDWLEAFYGFASGRVRWVPSFWTSSTFPGVAFQSHHGPAYGTNLGSTTLADRLVAARNIWDISTEFVLALASADPRYPKALYYDNGTRAFSLTDGVRDPAIFYRDNFPPFPT